MLNVAIIVTTLISFKTIYLLNYLRYKSKQLLHHLTELGSLLNIRAG